MSATQFSWGLAGKIYTDPAEYDVETLVAPILKIVALPVNGAAFPPPRKIIGDKAGTATVTDSQGNVITNFPITGQEQSLALTAINNLSATTQIWGLY